MWNVGRILLSERVQEHSHSLGMEPNAINSAGPLAITCIDVIYGFTIQADGKPMDYVNTHISVAVCHNGRV